MLCTARPCSRVTLLPSSPFGQTGSHVNYARLVSNFKKNVTTGKFGVSRCIVRRFKLNWSTPVPREALSEARGFLWKTIRRGGITFLLEEFRGSKRGKACMTYFLRFNVSRRKREKEKGSRINHGECTSRNYTPFDVRSGNDDNQKRWKVAFWFWNWIRDTKWYLWARVSGIDVKTYLITVECTRN